MRYIRTKDSRILESEINDNRKSLGYEPIPFIKQADTIEELVDEYVIHYANGYHLITINDGEVTFKDNFDYGFKLKFVLENEIYGEIWVDGELRKVAKMNDKGELELL